MSKMYLICKRTSEAWTNRQQPTPIIEASLKFCYSSIVSSRKRAQSAFDIPTRCE